MKAFIGIYDTHENAAAAIKQLQNTSYPTKQLTIIGQGEIVDGQARIESRSSLAEKEIGIGSNRDKRRNTI